MLTEKQIAERKNYIGASEAAGVVGLSRWQTPFEVWARKTGQIPIEIEETLPMWVGTKSEEIVAQLFTKETGKKVRKFSKTLYHKKYPFLACHIDRKVEGEDAILQCKTTSAWKREEWEDDIPLEYIIQEYHELAVTGQKKAYIACLIGNIQFVIKEIERDEKTIADLIKKEVEFWENFVIPKIMPSQIMARDSDILYQLFPRATEKEIVILPLPDMVDTICKDINYLQIEEKITKEQIEEQKNKLKAMLGKAEAGITEKYKITWKEQVNKRLDTKKIKTEAPEIYEQFSVLSESRVLRIETLKREEEKNE